jgi:hypothetical protein
MLITAALLPALAGCDQSRPVAQVRGKITCRNGSLPKTAIRLVRFQPTADSEAVVRKGASGAINDDGSFEMYTRRPGDGVHLGKYAVTFAFYRGAMDHTSPIPAKYMRASTTPYHVEVTQDIEDLEFQIETLGRISKPR